MKSIFLHYSLFAIILLILLYGCLNDRKKNPIAVNGINTDILETCKTDNEVISQTIQSIVDSLNNQIKICLGKDYFKYKVIYIGDSLRDFEKNPELYRKTGVMIDSINCEEKSKSKLELLSTKLSGGKEIKFVSSYKEYSTMVNRDSVNRILLAFSQVHFNKINNESIFMVMLSCSYNTGSDYAVYAKKENGGWVLKRIILAAIS